MRISFALWIDLILFLQILAGFKKSSVFKQANLGHERKTERPEGIAGVVKLVGTSTEGIFEHTQNLIDDTDAYTNMQLAQNPYGDGTASQQIVQALVAHFANEKT